MLAKPGNQFDHLPDIRKLEDITHARLVRSHVAINHEHINARCRYANDFAVICYGAVLAGESEQLAIEKYVISFIWMARYQDRREDGTDLHNFAGCGQRM